MASDPGICCFQHCGPKIFCLKLPKNCPACNSDLTKAEFAFVPFRLPYPFVKALQYPCSIIIKPTVGDFLNDYYNSSDLHIGVTTSSGVIVEFDRLGLRRHWSTQWDQCLLVDSAPEAWSQHWDQTLLEICKKHSQWNASLYNETTYNCYTFVLAFLKALKFGSISEAACDDTGFCEKYIVPRTTTAGKYISLYRKLRDHKYYIHKSS